MKILGGISPEYDEDGEVINASYMGGAIVAITEKEGRFLALLQAAWKGGTFRWDLNAREADNCEMDDQFKAIHAWVEAKFALNEFKSVIDDLDGLLMGKENESNDEI